MTAAADRDRVMACLVRLREQGIYEPVTDTLITESGLANPFEMNDTAYRAGRARTLRALASLELAGLVERGNDGRGDWSWRLLMTDEVKAEADRIRRALRHRQQVDMGEAARLRSYATAFERS